MVVALFDSFVRIRTVGPNPTYLKYFYVNNDQMYLDLKNLIPETSLDSFQQEPLTHLEQLFVGNTRLYTYQFGWITLEDHDLEVKAQKVEGGNNILIIDGKKYSLDFLSNRLYNPKKNSTLIKETEQGVIVKETPSAPTFTRSKEIVMSSNNTLEVDVILSQSKNKIGSFLPSFKIIEAAK